MVFSFASFYFPSLIPRYCNFVLPFNFFPPFHNQQTHLLGSQLEDFSFSEDMSFVFLLPILFLISIPFQMVEVLYSVLLAIFLPILYLFGLVASLYAQVLAAAPILTYVIVGASLYYLVSPHPEAFSAKRLNMKKIKQANWKRVQWKEMISPMKTGKNYTVIGAGFLGKKLIHSLLLRGETKIKAFDMDPTACDVFKNDPRVEFILGDVTNYEQVLNAIRGADVVYSTFAIIRFMDRLDKEIPLSYKVNVSGTENVVRACQEAAVTMLVQTSSSNVSVGTGQCTLDMDEKVPYVTRENCPNHYGWTKAIAEQIVLNANGVNGVLTAAIRPCSGIFGAEDRHMLEPMLKLGRALLTPNGGSNVIDFIYVTNVVWGHFLLEKALWDKPNEGIAGETFCISNSNPMRLLDFCGLVNELRLGGLVIIPAPYRLLVCLAYLVEFAKAQGIKVTGQLSQLTVATINYLDLSYAFTHKRAFEKLGYEPVYSMEEAIQMSIDEWNEGKMLPALN